MSQSLLHIQSCGLQLSWKNVAIDNIPSSNARAHQQSLNTQIGGGLQVSERAWSGHLAIFLLDRVTP